MPKFIPAHPKYALPKQKTRSRVKQHSVVQDPGTSSPDQDDTAGRFVLSGNPQI